VDITFKLLGNSDMGILTADYKEGLARVYHIHDRHIPSEFYIYFTPLEKYKGFVAPIPELRLYIKETE
jgi:hypothetical protein